MTITTETYKYIFLFHICCADARNGVIKNVFRAETTTMIWKNNKMTNTGFKRLQKVEKKIEKEEKHP